MTQTTVSVTEEYGTVPINYLSYEEEEERGAKRVQWLFIFQFWKVEGIDTDIAPIIPWYNSIGREWEKDGVRDWVEWEGRLDDSILGSTGIVVQFQQRPWRPWLRRKSENRRAALEAKA